MADTFDITVSGCDDSTKVSVDLAPEQLAFLTDIAARITAASEVGCMPTMTIRPHVHDYDCPESHR